MQTVSPGPGVNNEQMERSRKRLIEAHSYQDCSTVMIVPAIRPIHPAVVQSLLNLFAPMNQRFYRHLCPQVWPMMVTGAEVGDAYNLAIRDVLANPVLSQSKYVLTCETDNTPPPDGLLKLIKDIESGPYDACGAMYWTKSDPSSLWGEPYSQPMCYGKPSEMPKNFIPWLPPADSVVPCNGIGMGFSLFRMSIFQDKRWPTPGEWFKTVQEWKPNLGIRAYTQDLSFAEEAAKLGYRFACSTRVLVGHLDEQTGIMW